MKTETLYQALAAQRLAMPIGTDLLLHEHADAEAVRVDGARLGPVIVEAARRYRTPLAFPLMDLQIEKELMLKTLGIDAAEIATYHFDEDTGLEAAQRERLFAELEGGELTAKMRGALGAIEHVAGQGGDLVPMGMSIGPFSLLTKLLGDPITGIYMAAQAEPGDDEYEAVHGLLDAATRVISYWIRLQAAAGAKAVCLCEPAANTIYLSPNQLAADPGIFQRMVIDYNRRLRGLMADLGVDLIFHNCGELQPTMVRSFEALEPVIFSMGHPTKLWEAAACLPKSIVLFGNLPSKQFYSDGEYPVERLRAEAGEVRERMAELGHPYILGTECDVLAVRGAETVLRRKVEVMLES